MALLFGVTTNANGQGPFCGAVNTPGCNAIRYDSSIVIGWATGCTVVRGPVDIVDPDGPRVHFGEDHMAIGEAGTSTTNAVSLGDGGTATLTFAQPISNGPGPDFAVYENPYNDSFLELAFVEVSSDGERFVRFPATSLTPTETQVNGSIDPTMIHNLAGKFRVGYGTPFDLAELSDSAGIDINSITHVRLVDVVGTINPAYATYDAFGHMVNDPYPTNDTIWGSGGFDLTGVAVLAHTTAGIGDMASTTVTVYPNPTSSTLNISGCRSRHAEMYDMTGQKVAQWDIPSDHHQISTAGLTTGIYVLRIDGQSIKIIKK